MGTSWTGEQQSVIDHRHGNLLVAAAAGSGKTAVLSERILAMLSDENNPVNVDELLVVTFTRAAAAEMKDRIGKKISEYILAHPDNRHMQRQSALLHNSSITTIDSFCLQVVREFFHVIDMDPAFKIGDDSEMEILKSDIMEELLEEKYAEADPAFLNYTECYASGRSDDALEGQILRLYEASQSNPHPEEWLENCLKDAFYEDEKAFCNSEIARRIATEVKMLLEGLAAMASKAVEISQEPEGPLYYEETLVAEFMAIKEATEANSFEELREKVNAITFEGLSRKKNPNEQKKERAKGLRDKYKERIQKVQAKYFALPLEEIVEINNKSATMAKLLVGLTQEFSERFMAAKLDKGIFSFNDIEHFALYILTKDNDGKPSPAAEALRERYAEIIVDEYQDSNLLQETILNAISREHVSSPDFPEGNPNMFMVGDVKQSIYRFRRARPDLFMDKYEKYLEQGPYKKIMLRKNFRSRYQVLDTANTIFEWCMHREFGRIEYDSDAALYNGNTNYPDRENEQFNPDLIFVTPPETNEQELDNPIYREAYATAQYIKSVTAANSDFRITKKDELVKPAFGDFVILLRATKDWAEMFTRVLSDEGIPVKSEVKSGFFDTGEVKTALNFLKCLDNPKQDISFVSLLYSPVLRMSNDDLGNLVVKDEFVYDTVKKMVNNGFEGSKLPLEVQVRLKSFFDSFEFLRERKKVLSVSMLLDEVYRVTGLYKLMLALPAGERRAANLDFLREQAVKFEGSSYCGLFNFIRYAENLRDHEIDFGEASAGNTGDAVRIMTTHGSKGLEFPIVILPQIFKKFNNMDSNNAVVIHPELGPAMDYIDTDLRVKKKNLRKTFIAEDIKRENIAEELRIYYVALTRAREKLVLIGASDNLKAEIGNIVTDSDTIPYETVSAANRYFDIVKGAIFPRNAELLDAALNELDTNGQCFITRNAATTGNSITWNIRKVTGAGMPIAELEKSVSLEATEQFARSLFDEETDADSEETKALKAAIDFTYPFEKLTSEPLKHSVSELKHKAIEALQEDPDDGGQPAKWVENSRSEEDNSEEKKKSDKKQETGRNIAAERGTAMHRAMELMPFGSINTEEDVRSYIAKAVADGMMDKEAEELLDYRKIFDFTKSTAYKEMSRALKNKKLFREQPFVFGIKNEAGTEDDLNLIQGVIDVYYEETDGLVILDYKTDRATPEELKKLYSLQLNLYAQALEQITGKKVKKKLIYSFVNNAEIEL